MLKVACSSKLAEVLQDLVRHDPPFRPVAKLIDEIARAAIEMADVIALGPLYGDGAAPVGEINGSGDVQKKLDVFGNELFIEALRHAPVAAVLSEELDAPLALDRSAPLAVAIDPVDGSSNINANISIGTIFSVLPAVAGDAPAAHFLQPGRKQLAAGFIIYGPQTAMVLAAGGATRIFVLDRRAGGFVQAQAAAAIPPKAKEYAINASNYRHWTPSVRAFVDDCVKGKEGPLGQDQNMRWVASLVAEAYRILARGGVFLYPGDMRQGYSAGRLRLIYEANPISFVIEAARGAASDCARRILDIQPTDLHVRTPFVFGSSDVVHLITRYHTDPQFSAEHSPLFGRRGLMRF